MSLQTKIKPSLWKAVSSTYDTKNYSHAIVDAMHFLSDLLREKTGVEGDGVNLVGQALGGDSPRLRITKLQTDTEKSIQKGLEQILRGLYLAIRNPRSHEQVEDSQETADSIICFINYIVSIIDASKEPFTLSEFIPRVLDRDFVESHRYAELLAEEIPLNKRFDTLIELYRNKEFGEEVKLKLFFDVLYEKLTEDELTHFLSVVSGELKTTNNQNDIRIILQLLKSQHWALLDEVAKIRIENKLICSIQSGLLDEFGNTTSGALGTWAQRYIAHFTLKYELANVLLGLLVSNNPEKIRYVAVYFMRKLPVALTSQYQKTRCITAISAQIKDDNLELENRLVQNIQDFPDDWQKSFAEALKDKTSTEMPRVYLSDGTAFLSRSVTDDDIPF